MGQYGNSNLVIRATREDGRYVSGKIVGTWWGGIGTTWEARIRFNCLTAGCWPAWWLSNDHPVAGGEVDMVEWYGNGERPSGTTVHARSDGTSFATFPFPVDSGWHTWRVTWNPAGMYFWRDYVDGAEPYFSVPANSIDDWPFNLPDYRVFPVLNLAVSGSGGGDPKGGTYPADMLVDWVRVW
jgi:beta-glucanase (GH16 family)